MEAKLLKARPISGYFDELLFNANENTIYIKFEDQNYQEYCGIFGGGIGNKSIIVIQNEIAFVIAYGQGYIFSINEREVIHKSSNDHLEGVIGTGFNNLFLSYDLTNLFIYDTKLLWTSKRVSSDGIIIERVEGEIVYGKIYNFLKWVGFKLNLRSFEYECDWMINENSGKLV